MINDPINNLKDPEGALLTLIMTGQAHNKQEFSEKTGKIPGYCTSEQSVHETERSINVSFHRN